MDESGRHRQTKITWFQLYELSEMIALIEAEDRMVISRNSEEGKMGSCSMDVIVWILNAFPKAHMLKAWFSA
jgi:hypothetical protein